MAAEARYDDVADFYADGWTDTIDDPASVRLLALLEPVAGRRVLEIACGHGRISRQLARRGAAVVGADISAPLVGKAVDAERDAPLGIRYVVADVTRPGFLAAAVPAPAPGTPAPAAPATRELGTPEPATTTPELGTPEPAAPAAPEPNAFDAVVCSFGLSDIDDLDGAIATAARALRPGGVFVCSILHPCFPGGRNVSGSWPGDARYHAEGWWRADGELSSLRRQVGANHRTLSTYLNAFRNHGLWLDEMAEPEPAQAWAATRADAARFPVFLVLRCVKQGPLGT
ncbi:class I SAM-dependent methyltransferase [Nonomuraea sp. NPDC046802]|uniref:class I SAM-dependent methyltransferase n=1 Tax=Nonomuraea sp. NPDC046802 TaxID=3154919 RepID=UPI0033C5DBE5